ncbi:MAG: hypothetical protein U1E65_06555 [Myxococcota bacterium]
MMGAASTLLLALLAIPPPLCKGRVITAYDPALDQAPTARATAEVQAAYDALCPNKNCGRGVLYKNDSIGNNAVTWVSGVRDGERTQAKIVYSPRFLDALSKSYGDGASFGVLAHEVGHHLTAALSMRGQLDSSWDEELRADYLAGCALGRTGRPPLELEAALRALAASATPTHPSFAHRNPVIRKGYTDCKAHQDKFDKLEKGKVGFGIGGLVEDHDPSKGCWAYFYRAKEDIERIGPVAAERRRSKFFRTEAACNSDRNERVVAKDRFAEPCVCL